MLHNTSHLVIYTCCDTDVFSYLIMMHVVTETFFKIHIPVFPSLGSSMVEGVSQLTKPDWDIRGNIKKVFDSLADIDPNVKRGKIRVIHLILGLYIS